MSRRYPVAERYEERERDFYRSSGGARSERSFVEVDEDIGRPARIPDFLREDYGRNPAAGPMVLRERERVVRDEKVSRPREREVEKEEIMIRDRRDSARPVRDEREEVYYRRDEGMRRGREREEETDVVVKRREQSRSRRDFEVEETDVYVKRKGDTRPKRIEVEREDIRFRRGGGPPREVEEKEEIIYRRDDRDVVRERESERDRVVTRRRERSLPPPRLVAREREDFVIRRRRSPSPVAVEKKEEIIIRRTEREQSPASSVSSEPSLPPPPEPIYRPPIVQEVITHYKGVDHGITRARSPTPPPPPPAPKEETLEIAIRRKNTEGRTYDEEDIIFERETRERRRSRSRSIERTARRSTTDLEIVRSSRRRSLSAPRRRTTWDDDVHAEADFYNRKVAERAYIGEAYNGATKDWAIVDVPPGTRRVRMDGVGGGAQEITWQRYNGVRRSKFITDEEVYEGEFGAGAAQTSKTRKRDMWTEITKDLVAKEAIESLGYEYEETEYFYYVMEYLRYEDVMRLVEITEDIRRDRRLHIRQLQWERDELDRRDRHRDRDIYEREYIYDRRGRYR